jgi:hypothetical protein
MPSTLYLVRDDTLRLKGCTRDDRIHPVAGLVVSGLERRTAESWFRVPIIWSSPGFVRMGISLCGDDTPFVPVVGTSVRWR